MSSSLIGHINVVEGKILRFLRDDQTQGMASNKTPVHRCVYVKKIQGKGEEMERSRNEFLEGRKEKLKEEKSLSILAQWEMRCNKCSLSLFSLPLLLFYGSQPVCVPYVPPGWLLLGVLISQLSEISPHPVSAASQSMCVSVLTSRSQSCVRKGIIG